MAFRSGAAECWSLASVARITSQCPHFRDFHYPGDVSASQRYWSEDIVEPAIEVTANGTIQVPKTPGLGYAVKRERD